MSVFIGIKTVFGLRNVVFELFEQLYVVLLPFGEAGEEFPQFVIIGFFRGAQVKAFSVFLNFDADFIDFMCILGNSHFALLIRVVGSE